MLKVTAMGGVHFGQFAQYEHYKNYHPWCYVRNPVFAGKTPTTTPK